MKSNRFSVLALALLVPMLTLSGCQTLREVANLRLVDFFLDRVTDARLAGIDISRIRSYNDLSATDVIRLTTALTQKRVPLDFMLHVRAENPPENNVQARLVEMDWTLFLEDEETISGVLEQNIVLPAGQVTDIPIRIQLDLVDFFDRNLPDLVDLALSVAGQGGSPKRVMLRAVPTIDTPLGPLRYPQPITIASKEVG